jgi:flagellar protein FliS
MPIINSTTTNASEPIMFTSVGSRAASAYKRVSVETSDPYQVVNMLFESLLQAVAAAHAALSRGDTATKCAQITRAVRLIDEGLKPALNLKQGGELAANLNGLYGYCVQRLTHANSRNDEKVLTEVVRVIEPLAQGWRQMGGRVAV